MREILCTYVHKFRIKSNLQLLKNAGTHFMMILISVMKHSEENLPVLISKIAGCNKVQKNYMLEQAELDDFEL